MNQPLKIQQSSHQPIDLRDCSFLIPCRIDSEDRQKNLDILVRYIHRYFHTTIHIIEVDEFQRASPQATSLANYRFEASTEAIFHRTAINNQLINTCQTTYAIICDTDVIIPPASMMDAMTRLRRDGYSFAYPYDGRFCQVDPYSKRLFGSTLDIDVLLTGGVLYQPDTMGSVGGCFLFNVSEYRRCGGDNERIIGWGHEDVERIKRVRILGYDIYRSKGPLFHLWHPRNANSNFFDEQAALKSYEAYLRICSLTKSQLQEEIITWNRMHHTNNNEL